MTDMSAKEFHEAVSNLGLSVVGAAPYLGISPRQCQRIDAGECPVPKPVAKLLRIVTRRKIKIQELLE